MLVNSGADLTITICVSGWYDSEIESFERPWKDYFTEHVSKYEDGHFLSIEEFRKHAYSLKLEHFYHFYKPQNCHLVDKVISQYELNMGELENDIENVYEITVNEFWNETEKVSSC